MRFDVAPAEGYHPEIGLLLASLQDSTREWRDELGQVPDEAMTWQPFEGGHSIGGLIMHMIDAESWWFETICCGVERSKEELAEVLSEETNQDSFIWPKPPAKPLSWYYELQDRYRARSIETVKSLDPTKNVVIPGYDHVFTTRWVLAHVVEHDSYHGGQAVLLNAIWARR
ncbi:MAG TPA: DinB family protein [Fimbriimonas sp.]|nr:DinB family protein [Fimbriimonas sp.]